MDEASRDERGVALKTRDEAVKATGDYLDYV